MPAILHGWAVGLVSGVDDTVNMLCCQLLVSS